MDAPKKSQLKNIDDSSACCPHCLVFKYDNGFYKHNAYNIRTHEEACYKKKIKRNKSIGSLSILNFISIIYFYKFN
jgi:hypothetical protein